MRAFARWIQALSDPDLEPQPFEFVTLLGVAVRLVITDILRLALTAAWEGQAPCKEDQGTWAPTPKDRRLWMALDLVLHRTAAVALPLATWFSTNGGQDTLPDDMALQAILSDAGLEQLGIDKVLAAEERCINAPPSCYGAVDVSSALPFVFGRDAPKHLPKEVPPQASGGTATATATATPTTATHAPTAGTDAAAGAAPDPVRRERERALRRILGWRNTIRERGLQDSSLLGEVPAPQTRDTRRKGRGSLRNANVPAEPPAWGAYTWPVRYVHRVLKLLQRGRMDRAQYRGIVNKFLETLQKRGRATSIVQHVLWCGLAGEYPWVEPGQRPLAAEAVDLWGLLFSSNRSTELMDWLLTPGTGMPLFFLLVEFLGHTTRQSGFHQMTPREHRRWTAFTAGAACSLGHARTWLFTHRAAWRRLPRSRAAALTSSSSSSSKGWVHVASTAGMLEAVVEQLFQDLYTPARCCPLGIVTQTLLYLTRNPVARIPNDTFDSAAWVQCRARLKPREPREPREPEERSAPRDPPAAWQRAFSVMDRRLRVWSGSGSSWEALPLLRRQAVLLPVHHSFQAWLTCMGSEMYIVSPRWVVGLLLHPDTRLVAQVKECQGAGELFPGLHALRRAFPNNAKVQSATLAVERLMRGTHAGRYLFGLLVGEPEASLAFLRACELVAVPGLSPGPGHAVHIPALDPVTRQAGLAYTLANLGLSEEVLRQSSLRALREVIGISSLMVEEDAARQASLLFMHGRELARLDPTHAGRAREWGVPGIVHKVSRACGFSALEAVLFEETVRDLMVYVRGATRQAIHVHDSLRMFLTTLGSYRKDLSRFAAEVHCAEAAPVDAAEAQDLAQFLPPGGFMESSASITPVASRHYDRTARRLLRTNGVFYERLWNMMALTGARGTRFFLWLLLAWDASRQLNVRALPARVAAAQARALDVRYGAINWRVPNLALRVCLSCNRSCAQAVTLMSGDKEKFNKKKYMQDSKPEGKRRKTLKVLETTQSDDGSFSVMNSPCPACLGTSRLAGCARCEGRGTIARCTQSVSGEVRRLPFLMRHLTPAVLPSPDLQQPEWAEPLYQMGVADRRQGSGRVEHAVDIRDEEERRAWLEFMPGSTSNSKIVRQKAEKIPCGRQLVEFWGVGQVIQLGQTTWCRCCRRGCGCWFGLTPDSWRGDLVLCPACIAERDLALWTLATPQATRCAYCGCLVNTKKRNAKLHFMWACVPGSGGGGGDGTSSRERYVPICLCSLHWRRRVEMLGVIPTLSELRAVIQALDRNVHACSTRHAKRSTWMRRQLREHATLQQKPALRAATAHVRGLYAPTVSRKRSRAPSETRLFSGSEGDSEADEGDSEASDASDAFVAPSAAKRQRRAATMNTKSTARPPPRDRDVEGEHAAYVRAFTSSIPALDATIEAQRRMAATDMPAFWMGRKSVQRNMEEAGRETMGLRLSLQEEEEEGGEDAAVGRRSPLTANTAVFTNPIATTNDYIRNSWLHDTGRHTLVRKPRTSTGGRTKKTVRRRKKAK